MPRKLRTSPEHLHGRGLAIIAQLSTRWAARADGHGKTVWSTLRLARASGRAGQAGGDSTDRAPVDWFSGG
jgi:hypothetical protein